MSFIQTDVKYFRPNRTLECYTHNETGMNFYIYNYEGIHFRLFKTIQEKDDFFKKGIEPEFDFGNEDRLDKYLENHY